MPIKSMFFLFLFGCFSLGSLINPILGVIGYIGHYHIAPEDQWWGISLNNLGIRYSFTLGIFFAVGTILNWKKLKFKKLFHSQEILLIIFYIIIWLSQYTGFKTDAHLNPSTYPPIKIAKVSIFIILLTHVITDLRSLKIIIWTFVLLGLYLGYSCYTAPPSAFIQGRLSIGIGGPDFSESSFLAGHFMAILPLIASIVLLGKWKQKIIAIIAAAFVIDGIILTQTRAALVGAIIGGIFAIVLAVPGHRKKILIFLLIGFLGTLSLTDQHFWKRMATINGDEQGELDESARGRKVVWKIAIDIMKARPQGIGATNFTKYMGDFNDIYEGKDTHNTFLRCGAELGVHGFIVLLIMVANSFFILRRVKKKAIDIKDKDVIMIYAYMFQLTLIIFFSCGMFMSQTYVEETYWFLLLPVCLERIVENSEITTK